MMSSFQYRDSNYKDGLMTILYLIWEFHTRKDSLYIEMGPWVPLPIDDVSSGGDDFLGRFHIAIESVVHHDSPAPSYDSTSSAAWKPISQDKQAVPIKYTPALISTHPIKKYPTNSPIFKSLW